jgi:DNA helicase-2/ATP-dependent DNA helicase PcrA
MSSFKKQALIQSLNPQQRDAVFYIKGPSLVLAGAGSGKTRVITYRFAHLVHSLKIPPTSVLTMTFTNKAAEEMKQRVGNLLNKNTKDMWIGTFHAICNRILRKEIENLGYKRNFAIHDEDDTCSVIRSILKEFRIHEALYKGISCKMSSLKASLIDPEKFLAMTNDNEDHYGFDEKFARVYVRYQDEMKKNNALDFDDLIMLTVTLFEKYPEILKKYHDEFPYFMIDEFQDTNIAQYRFAKLLAGKNKNICVVGDDDQSIYRFRGANVKNILSFEKDFPKAKIIRLEQNYRSTQNILNAAGEMIIQNPSRKRKKLWTEKDAGEKLFYCITNDEKEEARYIARSIRELYLKGKHSYGDFAVLYRVNVQSRALEEALREFGLPYKVIGGISFYQRKEIKDIISYLRVVNNPQDFISIKRIINCPPRGIGTATINRIENESRKRNKSFYEVLKQMATGNGEAATGLKAKLNTFVKLIEKLMSYKTSDARSVLQQIIGKSGYKEWAGEERNRNLKELVDSAEGKDIRTFLDSTSLFSSMDAPHGGDSVSLMTLHSAKGLEFPVVFITGIEDGLLPHFHTFKSPEELQEERRLFYVGMTRAQELLILSSARKRKLYSLMQKQEASPAYYQCIEKKPRKEMVTHTVEMPASLIGSTPFVTGARVRHPKWGVGVVRDCYGEIEDLKVMVNFSSVGVKRLSLKFANLEKL